VKDKRLPTSRLGRLGRLALLGGRMTGGKLAGLIGVKNDQKLATAATEALGQMRGLALKVGQMASYVDGVVPEEHRAIYEKTMASLRAAAPTMAPEAARRVIEQELGAAPEALFAHFEELPFASASIGQVHHAELNDGRAVAVKVQFEGIERAVESDLGNASLFGTLLGPLGSKFGVEEQLAEVRARFLEELDYRHEARQQQRFATAFADDDAIRVPAVVEALSAQRVLTSEFATGFDFERACEASEDERRAWAETLWRFVFGSLLHHGLFNADPHPGNYLFHQGGTIDFLDFGCTRELPPQRVEQVRDAHRAANAGDLEALSEAAMRMFEIPAEGRMAGVARPYIHKCFSPFSSPGRFKMTRRFAAELLGDMRDNAKQALRWSKKDIQPMPAEWVFFNRLQLGFYSVLARLDVAVDYHAVETRLLARLD
jgi:predicted unusual protein kinase regulating ubiquinone biosynthesis (AarF/ABC1/UbiB family)